MKTADGRTRNYGIHNTTITAAHLLNSKLFGKHNACLCLVPGSNQKKARKKKIQEMSNDEKM